MRTYFFRHYINYMMNQKAAEVPVQMAPQGPSSPKGAATIPQSSVIRNWEANDHYEIYLIKPESLKKSYDNIVKKLQKERIKFLNKTKNQFNLEDSGFLPRDVEEEVEKDAKQLKEQFTLVKDLLWRQFRTKQILNQKSIKMKKNIEQARREEDLHTIGDFKDSDIAQYYHMERQKMQAQQIRKQ